MNSKYHDQRTGAEILALVDRRGPEPAFRGHIIIIIIIIITCSG